MTKKDIKTSPVSQKTWSIDVLARIFRMFNLEWRDIPIKLIISLHQEAQTALEKGKMRNFVPVKVEKPSPVTCLKCGWILIYEISNQIFWNHTTLFWLKHGDFLYRIWQLLRSRRLLSLTNLGWQCHVSKGMVHTGFLSYIHCKWHTLIQLDFVASFPKHWSSGHTRWHVHGWHATGCHLAQSCVMII